MTSPDVGWCHECGRLQLYSDARWVVPHWWPHDGVQACCVDCDEPWGLGVWPAPDELRECARRRHVTWSPDRCETCDHAAA